VVFEHAPLPSCNTVTCTVVTGCIPANYNQKTPTVPITPAPLSIIELQIGNPVFKLNNQALLLDSPPVIKNDRTLLPIRAVVEAMGGQVNWNAEERRVDIEYRGKTVTLWIGKNTAKVSYPRLKSWACSSKPLQGLLTETHPPASLNRPGGDWLRRFCFS